MNTTSDFDPYHKWFGIPPSAQPADHYRLLRIEPLETDAEVIEHAYDKEWKGLEPYEREFPDLVERLRGELREARHCLLNATLKAAYDQQLCESITATEQALQAEKDTARRKAIEHAVQQAHSAIASESQQLRAAIAEFRGQEQQALNTAAQLRQQLAQASSQSTS